MGEISRREMILGTLGAAGLAAAGIGALSKTETVGCSPKQEQKKEKEKKERNDVCAERLKEECGEESINFFDEVYGKEKTPN